VQEKSIVFVECIQSLTLQDFGVEKRWPTHLIPMEVVGVIHLNKSLCYVVKHHTQREYKQLCSANCVIIKSKNFRLLYPHVIIAYYEQCLTWVTGDGGNGKAKEAKTDIKIKEEVISDGESEGDNAEELPKISIKKDEDLFCGDDGDGFIDDREDDLFVPIK